MPSIVAVEHLVKRYKKAEENAVDDISFSIGEGQFFAFLGPNGAGKTTTISVLTTTLSKTAGRVTIAGHDLDQDSSAVRRNIGVIFQNPSLDLNLTAEENIRLHAMLYGLYPFRPSFRLMPEEYKRRAYELADVLNIRDALFKPVKTLSGGMKRKFEIIRSLIHQPKVLFLDEPTAGLDPVSRANLWQYLHKVREKERVTMFLTTHYLDEAEGADSICIINHGKIALMGTPQEVKEKLTDDYLVLDATDRDALRRELTRLGLPFTENQHVRVDIQRNAQRVIRSITTPLTVLKIVQPTLEEAYISIIGHDE